LKKYIADLHIHTVLSPCGDVEMSPKNILHYARKAGLDIIGITDHNSTLQAPVIKKAAKGTNIKVLLGAEITTKEEIHCLTFFENEIILDQFQTFIENHYSAIKNKPELFGFQLVVNENEDVIQEVDIMLSAALTISVDQLQQKTESLGGIFIPAHVDKAKNSIFSQLGFLPEDLSFDALELSRHHKQNSFLKQHPQIATSSLIQSSDAHYPQDIGAAKTAFEMADNSWNEIKLALKRMDKRKTLFI